MPNRHLLASLAAARLATVSSATLLYQGLATDDRSNPKPNGSYAIKFALFAIPAGGSGRTTTFEGQLLPRTQAMVAK